MNSIKKLLISLIVAACTVCFVFGIAGCEPESGKDPNGHIHSFSEEWMSDATEHWHEATCEHTDEKGSVGTHIDEDSNGKCDVCGYTMQTEEAHTHTFDYSHWEHDANTHWHAATCSDTTERQDEAPHVDEDDNQACDVCEEYVPHTHKFSETEWGFDLENHWHPTTCGHNEKSGEAEHSFANGGVCECGLKEDEVTAYNTLKAHEIPEVEETDFYTWLTGLKADGVTDVRVTEKGDIVYDRSGVVEGVYVTERTVKVKATIDGGNGLEHVWFKVADTSVTETDEHNTNALGVGETGADGIATITFQPAGYITYKIMLAEAKDVAALESGEEAEIKVIPNRYSLKNSSAGKGEVVDIVVGETDETGTDDITGTLEFKYDVSWAASDKRMLSYERYYANAVTGAGEPIVKGDPDTFTATGDNIFDYLLFAPAQSYNWNQGNSSADFDKIADNYRKAASGVYKISFTVSEGTAQLFYWDGIDLANGQKETDGTPSNMYVKSVSGNSYGSAIDSSAFTGENSVSITIEGYRGLSDFQLGIKCEKACQVTITVQRQGDYVPPPPEKLKLGLNTAYTDSRKGYKISALATTTFELDEDSNITDGWYTLEVIPYDEYCIMPRITENNGDYWIGASLYNAGALICSASDIETMLWQTGKDGKEATYGGRSVPIYNKNGAETGRTHGISDLKNVSLKGVIYLTGTSSIDIRCTVNVTYYADIKIEAYNKNNIQTLAGDAASTIEKDTAAFVPGTKTTDEARSFEFGFGDSIDENTIYRIQVIIPEPYVIKITDNGIYGQYRYANLILGGDTNKVNGIAYNISGTFRYEINTKIKKSDKLKITVGNPDVNIFMAEVIVSAYQNVQLGVSVEYEQRSMQNQERRLTFTAEEEGTYQVTLTRVRVYEHDDSQNPEYFTDGDVSTFDVKNLLNGELIIKHTRQQRYVLKPLADPVLTVSGTFEMQAGESIALGIINYMFESLDFTLTVTKV